MDNGRRFTAWIFEGETGLLREGEGILPRPLTEVILLGMGAQEEHLPSECRSLGRSPILPGGLQPKLWCLKYWFLQFTVNLTNPDQGFGCHQ